MHSASLSRVVRVGAGELVDRIGIQEMYLYVAAIGFTGAAIGLFVRRSKAADDGENAVGD